MYAYGEEQFTYATDGQGDGGFLTNNLAIKSLFSWEEEENNGGGEATVGANGEGNYNFSDSVLIFPECNRLIIGGHNGSTGGTWNGTILRLSFYPPAYLSFQAHLGEVPYLTKEFTDKTLYKGLT